MGLAQVGVLVGLQAAGWPIGLALAGLLLGQRIRESRRRDSLNLALHELRRPLQELVLSSPAWRNPGSASVRVTLAALGDLDRAINGGPRRFEPRPVACRAIVQAAVERWRGVAAASQRSLILRWRAGAALVMMDPERVGQALDNLIHNAILHGGLRVRVEASAFVGGVRISVVDSGPRAVPRHDREHRHRQHHDRHEDERHIGCHAHPCRCGRERRKRMAFGHRKISGHRRSRELSSMATPVLLAIFPTT